MKNAWFVPLLAFGLLVSLALGSCQAIAAPTSGYVLSVDSNKHLTQDVSYNLVSGTANIVVDYKKDGTYQRSTFTWDAPSSKWVQSGGERGKYTWDAASFVLTDTVDASYTGTQWIGVPTGEFDVRTEMKAFTDHALYDVYAYANETGTLTGTETVKSLYAGVGTDTKITRSYTFKDKAYTHSVTTVSTVGATTTSTRLAQAGSITGSYPANAVPSVGSSLSYVYQESTNTLVVTVGANPAVTTTNAPMPGTVSVSLITHNFAAIPLTDLSRGR